MDYAILWLLRHTHPGLENDFNSTWQSSYTSNLETIAATATMASAKAQALLQYVTDLASRADTAQYFTQLYAPTFEAVDASLAPQQPAGVANMPAIKTLDIKAYPDPVTDLLQLEVNNATASSANLHIVICDNLGRTCVDQIVQAEANSNITRAIDMGSLANGMYFLSVSGNNSILLEQNLVKQ